MAQTLTRMTSSLSVLIFLCSGLQAQSLHGDFSALLADVVRDGRVDYPQVGESDLFRRYLKQLSRTNPDSILIETERLAFWINAYNAFTMKLIVDHMPVESIREITVGGKGPWDVVWIDINGTMYSLNQIEHGTIRKQFNEPLIHMVLVCAAISCPPLLAEAYTGERLKEQMEYSAMIFLRDPSKNRYDEATGTLYLSELFQWYGDDFIDRYGSAARFVLGILGIEEPDQLQVKYLPYNWDLNSQ